MAFSGIAASKMVGNKMSEKATKFNRQHNIGKVARSTKKRPVTQSQRDLITKLRKCLDDAGVANDFIIEPDDGEVASHIIRALIRLANEHGVDTGRGNRSLNGV